MQSKKQHLNDSYTVKNEMQVSLELGFEFRQSEEISPMGRERNQSMTKLWHNLEYDEGGHSTEEEEIVLSK